MQNLVRWQPQANLQAKWVYRCEPRPTRPLVAHVVAQGFAGTAQKKGNARPTAPPVAPALVWLSHAPVLARCDSTKATHPRPRQHCFPWSASQSAATEVVQAKTDWKPTKQLGHQYRCADRAQKVRCMRRLYQAAVKAVAYPFGVVTQNLRER